MATSQRAESLAMRQPWLFGWGADLFVGCGLAYLLSVPVLFLMTRVTGAEAFPPAIIFFIGWFINGPHYGATLLRVYDSQEDRKKYVFFAVYVTIVLAGLFAAASWNVWIASILVTTYVVWSPWHFSGQNYGLMLMFLRRRGIDVDSTTKRILYTSFVLSSVLAIIAIQGGNEASVFAPATLRAPNTPRVMHWTLPSLLTNWVQALTFVVYAGCLVGAAWRLQRRTRLRDLAPASLLVCNQALWFTIPALIANGNEPRGTSLFFAAAWINVAHSLQYLWVTSYYARNSQNRTSVRSFLLKSFVAGSAVTTLPGLLMAPNLLGAVPWDVGLAATLFSIVNIHHFILDGAIWKLRDGRVARVLLRASTNDRVSEFVVPPLRRPWLRRIVWIVAAASILIPIVNIFETNAIREATRGDLIDRSLRRLKWIGRETTELQFNIGKRYAIAGQHDKAIEHYRRSVELFPTARAWAAQGVEYRALGDWDSAIAAFEAAIELSSDYYDAHFRRAEALLAIESLRASDDARDEAIVSLERVLEIKPGHVEAVRILARVYTEEGRTDLATLALQRALEEVEPSAVPEIRAEIDRLRTPGNIQ